MDNQLSIEEKLIFTRVKKAAVLWLLMIRLDPQPVNETTAADIIQIDKETARKYLRTLSELGIATRLGRYDGYSLTDGGRQIALPLQLKQLQEANAGIPRSTIEESSLELASAGIPRSADDQTAGNIDRIDYIDEASAEIPRSNAGIPRSAGPLKEEEEEEEVIKKSNKSSSSSLEAETEYKTTMLEQTELLFESAVLTWGIDLEWNTPENIIGWIAEAYDRRHKLDSPPSLVYSRLKDQTPARNRYKIQPEKYLPENYLLAIGRADLVPDSPFPICPDCGYYPCECPEGPEQELKYEEPHPRIKQKWSSARSMTPETAWEAALGQLQMEMPKAAFDTWVSEAQILDADEEQAKIIIGAFNEYAVDWLESRLSSTITRLLTGIMNATLKVEIRKIQIVKDPSDE